MILIFHIRVPIIKKKQVNNERVSPRVYVVYSIFVEHKSCGKSGISENFPIDNENKTSHYFKTHHILIYTKKETSVKFSHSVTSDSLCHPMHRRMPGLPVQRQLPELTQTHVYSVSDAIQPSHPLSSPSPPAHNPSQHQGVFQ